MSGFSSVSNITTESNSRNFQIVNFFLVLMAMIKNYLLPTTVSIYDHIMSEVLSLNISPTPRFKKVLELVENVSKTYIPPNGKLIYKERLDFIHDQKMKSNLAMI